MDLAIGAGLAGRTILASNADVALAELLDGEKEVVDARSDRTFDEDLDDRPVPFRVPRFRVAVLEVATGELLGTMNWHPVPLAPTLSSTAWNIGIQLLPTARGRGLGPAAGLLLVGHLFATTGVDRVQAITDVANVPGWRGLEKLGFRREGVLRGTLMRDGQRRDEVSYSMLRADLERTNGERTVLGRRDGVVLAQDRPGDRAEVVAASDDAFALDPDQRLSPVAPPAVLRGAVLDADTGRLLGLVSWHAVGHGGTAGCAAWNIGITVICDARGRGVGTTAQRLLAEYLFATTALDRVEAGTDVDNVAEQRALEKAGFRRDGVIRGAQLRGGQRRDMALYGILRTDLDGSGQ